MSTCVEYIERQTTILIHLLLLNTDAKHMGGQEGRWATKKKNQTHCVPGKLREDFVATVRNETAVNRLLHERLKKKKKKSLGDDNGFLGPEEEIHLIKPPRICSRQVNFEVIIFGTEEEDIIQRDSFVYAL